MLYIPYPYVHNTIAENRSNLLSNQLCVIPMYDVCMYIDRHISRHHICGRSVHTHRYATIRQTYKDTMLHNINNTMSREEERRANDEREIKLACDELQDFGAMYRSPDDGETPQRRKSRKQTIKRSIAAAKKKKRDYDQEEKELRRDCERLRVPYHHPNNSEDDEARRKRLRAFVLEEEALQLECYRGQVEYVHYTLGEDTDDRRRRLREHFSNREKPAQFESLPGKVSQGMSTSQPCF